MSSKKKDLEIIYNLQWKNKPANGGDKANIIGMYDIPTTTLNWEIFKSYLLKNSGTVGDDVKVSYITDSNREFPIESQTDFQIALYAFRRKARMGDIVNLKLDRISDRSTHKNNRHSNDVETQFDNEAVSLTSTCCNADTPPDWFTTYMSQFKKSFTDELTTTIANIVSTTKPSVGSQPSSYYPRKSKAECPKRLRKIPQIVDPHETKEVIKSLKLESKLERKLEKLEHKTKKIKERKLALLTKSSDSDAGPSSSRSLSYKHCEKDNISQYDAAPVNSQTVIPHMLGGEVYLHQWEVINTGKLPWTPETTLHFTWGAKALKPLDSIISVPTLKPGESGLVAVRLQIPHQPGQYECYWHFHHKEKRFGHWLGCQIIVDPFDLKGANSVLETSFVSEFITNPKKFKANDEDYDIDQALTEYSKIVEAPLSNTVQTYNINVEANQSNGQPEPEETVFDEGHSTYYLNGIMTEISSRVKDLKLHDPTDTNCSSDSDNQSIISLSESNSSKSVPDEFVVIPIPDCFKIEQDQGVSNEITIKENKVNAEPRVDSVVRNIPQQNAEHTLEDVAGSSTIQNSENYDDNNNSEKVNQNPSTSESSNKVEDDVCSNDGSQKSDIIIVSLPDEKEQADAGYAYLVIDGHKVPIPKMMLKSEYLKSTEETSMGSKVGLSGSGSSTSSVEVINKETVTSPQQLSENVITEQENISTELHHQHSNEHTADNNMDILSHCSAAGSCFSDIEQNAGVEPNSRLFIFPQSGPGYEAHVAEGPVSSPPLNLSTHSRNPFTSGTTEHVPNYQQTLPNMRQTPPGTPQVFPNHQTAVPNLQAENTQQPQLQESNTTTMTTNPENARFQENAQPVHILPETLVSGAVNVASSAINTARSVLNMIVTRDTPVTTTAAVLQQPGRWVNGHWVSTNPETPREANLQALAEMGFWNRDLNATLLARYNDDLSRVVAELVQ